MDVKGGPLYRGSKCGGKGGGLSPMVFKSPLVMANLDVSVDMNS